MNEERLCAAFLLLGEVSELTAIVHGNSLEDLGEMLAVFGKDGLAGLVVDSLTPAT